MVDSLELLTIVDRILNGSADEGDINLLRQSLTASSGQYPATAVPKISSKRWLGMANKEIAISRCTPV